MTTRSPTHTRSRPLARAAFALTLAGALLGTGTASAFAATAAADKPASLVVIVLSPYLTWRDVSATSTPELGTLASTGSTANMNSNTADQGWPTAAGGALTLGAGRWAATVPGSAGAAEPLSALVAANAASLEPPTLGALGDAIHSAGGHTASVGFSDADKPGAVGPTGPASLVAMDRSGRVDFQNTSGQLATETQPQARLLPPGESDPALQAESRTQATSNHALQLLKAAGGPSLLVIDPGGLERAHDATDQTPAQAAARHSAAVRQLDRTIGWLRSAIPGDAVVLVVTPDTDKPYYEPPYLGPTIAAGNGFGGELSSASTHRPGLVANLDVAPTVLSALGIARPATMIGQPMVASPTPAPLAQRVAGYARLGVTVGAVDYVRDLYFIALYVGATIAVVLLAVALALLPLAGVRFIGRWWLLLVLSVPPGAWLMFLVERYPGTQARAAIALGIGTAVAFAAALALDMLQRRPEVPLLFLATLTALVIAADQWLGKPLESGLFSYSIRAGWRYYGMGNEGAALLVGASLAAIGLACDLAADKPWAPALRRWGIPVVGVVALLTAAAPFAGANAGVAVWGLVAFAAAWMRANRLPFTWKSVAFVLIAIAALVGGLVALDMLRGSGGETHLARFFSGTATGGPRAMLELVRRKAINNWNYLPQTPYTWLAVTMISALALVRFVPPRPLVPALANRPAYSGALLGLLVGGLAALVTEDSGIVMPALMLLAGATPALYLALVPAPASSGDADPDR